MEGESSVVLESCGEDSMLIQTVKSMVTENTSNALDNEERFFVITDVQGGQQTMMEVTNEEGTNQPVDKSLWSELCRVCANVNDHLIPIFEGEGLQHELCSKIHKYLPIHVSENDTLPLQLCYHCAATLLAWHELSEGCLGAERRLLEMQDSWEEKQTTVQQTTTVSNVAESIDEQQEITKDEPSGESAINDSDRWKTEPNDVVQISTVDIESTNAEEVEYIECAQCDIVFLDMKCLIRHMNTAHNVQVYYCQYCNLAYRGETKDFEEHMLMHDNSYVTTKDVSQDDEMFEYKIENNPERETEITMKSDEPRKPLLYTCHLCEESYTRKNDLKRHISSHCDTKRIQNPDETELVNRAKQVVDDRVSYRCDICKKDMFTKRGFLRHIRVHSGKRPCRCDICGKCYRIEQDLARHIRDVHEGVKKYICDICGRAFANKGAKDDHRRIHTGERPYACEHCPKTFRTLNSIYIHNRVHTNYKPHKCSYCGRFFRSKQRLTNHETTHTGIKAFSCEICGKTFSVKGEVMRHRAIHSQEKPFKCKSCGVKFGQKRYLRNHIKLHHKEESSFLLTELLENRN